MYGCLVWPWKAKLSPNHLRFLEKKWLNRNIAYLGYLCVQLNFEHFTSHRCVSWHCASACQAWKKILNVVRMILSWGWGDQGRSRDGAQRPNVSPPKQLFSNLLSHREYVFQSLNQSPLTKQFHNKFSSKHICHFSFMYTRSFYSLNPILSFCFDEKERDLSWYQHNRLDNPIVKIWNLKSISTTIFESLCVDGICPSARGENLSLFLLRHPPAGSSVFLCNKRDFSQCVKKRKRWSLKKSGHVALVARVFSAVDSSVPWLRLAGSVLSAKRKEIREIWRVLCSWKNIIASHPFFPWAHFALFQC